MGLDMYLMGEDFYTYEHENRKLTPEVEQVTYRLGYWRKHPNLHGYIVNTFAGGEDNCQEISLTVEQLKKILAAVEADNLPHTTGFFFGESRPEDRETSIAILKGAIAWLEAEVPETVWRSVHYRASW